MHQQLYLRKTTAKRPEGWKYVLRIKILALESNMPIFSHKGNLLARQFKALMMKV